MVQLSTSWSYFQAESENCFGTVVESANEHGKVSLASPLSRKLRPRAHVRSILQARVVPSWKLISRNERGKERKLVCGETVQQMLVEGARAHALQQSWMSFYVSEWQIRLSSFKLAKSFSGNSHRYKTRLSGRQSTATLLCIPGRADFILIQLSKIFEVQTETACVGDLWFLRVRSWEDYVKNNRSNLKLSRNIFCAHCYLH